jgi:hypothetical protein
MRINWNWFFKPEALAFAFSFDSERFVGKM